MPNTHYNLSKLSMTLSFVFKSLGGGIIYANLLFYFILFHVVTLFRTKLFVGSYFHNYIRFRFNIAALALISAVLAICVS